MENNIEDTYECWYRTRIEWLSSSLGCSWFVDTKILQFLDKAYLEWKNINNKS